ncbi:vanadium-dependent haloperoxidase [Halorussus halophilus]|uniref:vanadium-dependent haloperoxidase n=1 Tax=Halorussus halophilus TaxID=2650975 RepID=UPI0017880901|nr:vanadium-dependent haloperoxidase [Halorussus halophilus]
MGVLATGLPADRAHAREESESNSDDGDAEYEEDGRVRAAYRMRKYVAKAQLYDGSQPAYETNGDRERYEDQIATFSKGLPHDDTGEVSSDAYQALDHALETGDPDDFEAVPLGDGTRQLKDPQAAFGFELVGCDPHDTAVPPPPAFESEAAAAEMAGLYWRTHCLDVPFSEYGESDRVADAAADLQKFSGRDPSAETLFADVAGDRPGPRISQFLWQTYARGALQVDQRLRTGEPGIFYVTDYDEWLASQRGAAPSTTQYFDDTERYVRSGRDLAEFVHEDVPIQPFDSAVLFLLGREAPVNPTLPFEGAPLDPSIPYETGGPSVPFVNFGFFDAMDAVVSCLDCALSAAWFHKWLLHRRLRPEKYGGRIHNQLTDEADYPIPDELLDSPVLDRIYDRHDSYLLPQVYPEGAPLHPAYPSGHAAVAGACATVIKAYFDESFVFDDPVRASADGTQLRRDVEQDLTLRDEVDKLAANVAYGRVWATVHYASDARAGLRLGEQVALDLLWGRKHTSHLADQFDGWQLTTFDGEQITV